ncbi:Hypothetical_protein [Hexamita inflata]|uniref:Hypothetical_protein n=1 Tax=Hexamita inflata TaxID=28002 RepID=A0ABP1LLP2_9EUKA
MQVVFRLHRTELFSESSQLASFDSVLFQDRITQQFAIKQADPLNQIEVPIHKGIILNRQFTDFLQTVKRVYIQPIDELVLEDLLCTESNKMLVKEFDPDIKIISYASYHINLTDENNAQIINISYEYISYTLIQNQMIFYYTFKKHSLLDDLDTNTKNIKQKFEQIDANEQKIITQYIVKDILMEAEAALSISSMHSSKIEIIGILE